LNSSLYGATAEYALHSLLYLAAQPHPASVRDLARFQQLPERFLSKLFTRLKKAGLVKSAEGIQGGFTLARPAARISVRDVLEASDPNRSLFACGEIRRRCALYGPEPPAWSTHGPCRIHHFMNQAEEHLFAFLATKSLADLGAELEAKAPAAFLRSASDWFQIQREGRVAKPKDSHHD